MAIDWEVSSAALSARVRLRGGSSVRGLVGCLLILCCALGPGGCSRVDPALEAARRVARKEIDEALQQGEPSMARQAIHGFSRALGESEAGGQVSESQSRRARLFIDELLAKIVRFEEDRRLAAASESVDAYLRNQRFAQARRYLQALFYGLDPSDRLETGLEKVVQNLPE